MLPPILSLLHHHYHYVDTSTVITDSSITIVILILLIIPLYIISYNDILSNDVAVRMKYGSNGYHGDHHQHYTFLDIDNRIRYCLPPESLRIGVILYHSYHYNKEYYIIRRRPLGAIITIIIITIIIVQMMLLLRLRQLPYPV